MHFTEADIDELLDAFPRLRRRPTRQRGGAVVAGFILFEASSSGKPAIADEYRIRLEVSLDSSSALPKAFEEGGRIPAVGDHHVNPGGDLCLGSPLRILQTLGPNPTLVAFVEKCVVPFLYAASWREQGLPGFPFDELAHGAPGLVADYESLFSVVGPYQVARALFLLGKRKRVANKMPCPCGCGRRLVKCTTHARLASFRRLAPRSFYVKQAAVVLRVVA
ncbi:hypothetical protein GGR61_003091 [Xanthomonas arboricola]|nr:hypothetical protein [Xanthomonas sp. 3058]